MPESPRDTPDERDPLIGRIADALRPFPAVDPEARARVLVAVAAERARPPASRRAIGWRRLALPVAIAATLLLGVALGRTTADDDEGVVGAASAAHVAAPDVREAPATLAAGTPADAGRVAVQFLLRAPDARRVVVVGDFTGWDAGRVAMTRDAASGLWSATVMVPPGRHVYGFLADDTVWMRDPRAPVATDADYGRAGSLLLVGRP